MKILFVMRHSGYVRNFESTLRMLCDRGHTVHLAFQIAGVHELLDAGDTAQALCDRYPRFSRGAMPVRDDAWAAVARELRMKLDYLRYLAPLYCNAPKLVARARREVPEAFVRRTQERMFTTRGARAALSHWLRGLHRAIPTDPRIDAYLGAHRPDLLVVTPLIESGAPQAEYLRSARSLGIRSAICVASWDNLTNKGLIHGPVDLVTVWNETMKREAVELHGVPPDRVVVTGAQPFDHWFDWEPSATREAFCRRVGLPADRPFVAYLCSSRFIAPEEGVFVREWIRQLRQSASRRLREAGVLVRPHPQNADQWADVDLGEDLPVAVWPRGGEVPAELHSRTDYFDTIHHSAAVVAVNTTAEIESAIIGRGVYTLLAPAFRDTQAGTLHFDHLRRVNGGLVHVAESYAQHFDQVDAALRDSRAGEERCRRFVEAFVRPYGLDVPATPKLVEALERLARESAPIPERAPQWAPLVQPGLARKGAQIQRAALLAVEIKTARKAAKKAAAAPVQREEQPAKRRLEGLPPTWRGLASAFRALSYENRVRFGQATIDAMPGELLLENARPERLDYPDAEIHLRVLSKHERERLKACVKEPFTVEWIHRCIRPGDVLYDIGANVGAYSLVAAKKPSGGARVFAFEPSYANVASLCANIVLNRAAEQITPIPVALSDSSGLATLGLRALEPGSARHVLGDRPSSEGSPLYHQPVMTFRLDDLVARYGIPPPNHIKLDVDGGELAVLEGASVTLSSPSLRSVLVEVSTPLSEAVTALLLGRGLTLDTKVNVKNKIGEYLVWYGLFTRVPSEAQAPQEERVRLAGQ